MNQDAFEILQSERHFNLDPVFSCVCALYACDRLGIDSGIRAEVSDSVVLLDFEDHAWHRSKAKSGIMREYHNDVKQFMRRNLNVTKVCGQCGKEYHPPFGTEKRSKLCGIKCRAEKNKGKPSKRAL